MTRMPRTDRTLLTLAETEIVKEMIRRHFHKVEGSEYWRWDEGWSAPRANKALKEEIPSITVNKVAGVQLRHFGKTRERDGFGDKAAPTPELELPAPAAAEVKPWGMAVTETPAKPAVDEAELFDKTLTVLVKQRERADKQQSDIDELSKRLDQCIEILGEANTRLNSHSKAIDVVGGSINAHAAQIKSNANVHSHHIDKLRTRLDKLEKRFDCNTEIIDHHDDSIGNIQAILEQIKTRFDSCDQRFADLEMALTTPHMPPNGSMTASTAEAKAIEEGRQ